MAFRPIFRNDQTFTAIRDFTSGGSLVKMGQRFDRTKYPLHVLKLWFNQRKIGQADCAWSKEQIEASKVKYGEKTEYVEETEAKEAPQKTEEELIDGIPMGDIQKFNPQGPYYDVWNGSEYEAHRGRAAAEKRAEELKGAE